MARGPRSFHIYTDGAGSSEPNGVGGWAAIIQAGRSKELETLSGAEEHTDSRSMEIRAIVEGLNALPAKSDVTVVTDVEQIRQKLQEMAQQLHNGHRHALVTDPTFGAMALAVERHQHVEALLNIRKNPHGKVRNVIIGTLPEKQEAHDACRAAAEALRYRLNGNSNGVEIAR